MHAKYLVLTEMQKTTLIDWEVLQQNAYNLPYSIQKAFQQDKMCMYSVHAFMHTYIK